jgi:hypothetical protein
MLLRLRVTVNEDKTRIVSASERFDFLGVHFRKQQTPGQHPVINVEHHSDRVCFGALPQVAGLSAMVNGTSLVSPFGAPQG